MKQNISAKLTLILILLLIFNANINAKSLNSRDSIYTKSDIKKLEQTIRAAISDKKATVGLSVATDRQEILTMNRNTRFSLMSVFKFHIALAVLDKLDKNNTPLDSLLFIEKSKLLHNTYSPIIKKFPNQDLTISIGDLIKYSVSHSDNNACDLLIEYVGGASEVDKYIRSLGIDGFSISLTERIMHDDIKNQYINWSTPESAIELMKIFLNKHLFSKQYKDFLIQTMIDTSTGKNKLKAMLPADVIVGHKTGSSNRMDNGIQIAENDIAFIYLPDGKIYYISVFVKDSKESDDTNIEIIAEISKIVYDFFCKK